MKNKQKKQKKTLKEIIIGIAVFLKTFFLESIFLFKFFILLFFVSIKYILTRSPKRKLNKPNKKGNSSSNIINKKYDRIYTYILKLFDSKGNSDIKNSDLILLAMKNLSMKKNRTVVTIGGMAIGFGAIILLLSTGYGFEKLVVSQIASLSEMKQIDVNVSKGSPLVFNADTIEEISQIDKIDLVMPIVTSVSKITYNNAVSDVIVYGVSSDFLKESGMQPLFGNIFEESRDNIKVESSEDTPGEVAGLSSILITKKSFGEEISKVRYSINPLVWKPVYSKADEGSTIIGYTKRDSGEQEAVEVWGKRSDNDKGYSAIDVEGNEYSRWIKDNFLLWEKKNCYLTDYDCIDEEYKVIRDVDQQRVSLGYITEDNSVIERYGVSVGSSLEIYTGKGIEQINFGIHSGDFINTYLEPKEDSVILPVLSIDEALDYKGLLVYGSRYGLDEKYLIKSSNGKEYSYWVQATIDLWVEKSCGDLCSHYYTTPQDESYERRTVELFLKCYDLVFNEGVEERLLGKVLGEQDSSTKGSFIDLEELVKEDDSIDWVSISSELGANQEIQTDIKKFPADAQRVAIVNNSMLTLLGITANEALKKKFEATIIFDSGLFNRSNYIVESETKEFEIVGVISDNQSPKFFIPLGDIMVDGLENVSSVKVIVEDTKDVQLAREKLEGLGFQTSSVVDTVDSVSNLFHTLRIALLVLGLIALGVASLGMFNTLTVSLLEKTREVGLLKTMGLKSSQVKTLFLAESLIMSVLGGVFGLILGFIVGKLLSIFISILSVSQGGTPMDVTYIPFILGIGLVIVSAIVGVITGWYPAERAKKISALNALRYE